MVAIKDGITFCPVLKILEEDHVVTKWNAADTRKAMVGLIARYDDIDVIIAEYGVGDTRRQRLEFPVA